MAEVISYIQPELVVLTMVIYIVGVFLKKSTLIKDKYIPLILGGTSIFFCMLYFLGIQRITDVTSLLGILYNSIVQGVLIAGCATYSNQIIKQLNKKE